MPFFSQKTSRYCLLWRCLYSCRRWMLLFFFFMCQWVSIVFLFLQDVYACLKTSVFKVCWLTHLHCNSWVLLTIKIRVDRRSWRMCAFMSWRYKTLKRNRKKPMRSQKCQNVRSSTSFICWSEDSWCFVFLILDLAALTYYNQSFLCGFQKLQEYWYVASTAPWHEKWCLSHVQKGERYS